jgi:tRNA (mo5U34)-methyltransferase
MKKTVPPPLKSERRLEIERLGPWFHNLHLPDGEQTAPDHFIEGDFPSFKWREVAPLIPARLDGWRVLDVGCNAGFYSFELARRGASVLGIDVDEHYLTQARWAAGEFGLQDRVEFRQMEVYDLAREAARFDLVWFMGVFYHLRYPMLALDILARRTRRMMVFQTLTIPGETVYRGKPAGFSHLERGPLLDEGWPKMAFFEGDFGGDPTNWWAPNHAGIEAMLRSSGMRVTARPAHEIYFCEPDAELARQRVLFQSQFDAALGLAADRADDAAGDPP